METGFRPIIFLWIFFHILSFQALSPLLDKYHPMRRNRPEKRRSHYLYQSYMNVKTIMIISCISYYFQPFSELNKNILSNSSNSKKYDQINYSTLSAGNNRINVSTSSFGDLGLNLSITLL